MFLITKQFEEFLENQFVAMPKTLKFNTYKFFEQPHILSFENITYIHTFYACAREIHLLLLLNFKMHKVFFIEYLEKERIINNEYCNA